MTKPTTLPDWTFEDSGWLRAPTGPGYWWIWRPNEDEPQLVALHQERFGNLYERGHDPGHPLIWKEAAGLRPRTPEGTWFHEQQPPPPFEGRLEGT